MRALLARAYRAMSGRHKVHPAITKAAQSRGCHLEPLESRQLLSTTYYVSAAGHDNASGTSAASAWHSISRVNQQAIHAGDKVLFHGGDTFSGSLYFPSYKGGTSSSPVTISTYGAGKATIKSGGSNAINVAQTAGFDISNLNLIGSGAYANKSDGIYFHLDWANRKVNRAHIDNVEVSGYGGYGIMLKADGSDSGFNDVRVTDATLHDDARGGLGMWGQAGKVNSNVYVAHVKAYNNLGDYSTTHVSGSGIFIANVDNGIIEHNIAYNNGVHGAAPVGIWVAGCNRMTIQYNESYNNRTMTRTDGGGYDLDWDTVNSTVQYNYSHNNDGPAVLVAAGTHPTSGNTIRYNVSENDGRKNGRAAIQLWGAVANTSVYGNTVYMSNTGDTNSSAIWLHNAGAEGTVMSNVQVRNNIFYTGNANRVVNVSSDVINKGTNIRFSGNAYYSGGSTVKIQWGFNSYSTLSSWRKTGQEMVNGATKGYQGDPRLNAAGKGGTIGNADALKDLWAYRLQTSSPLINKGIAPPTTLSSTIHDFWGDTLPRSGSYDIGADEAG